MKKGESWWKILLMAFFSFGGFTVLLAFIPDYSLIYLVVGIVLSIIATMGAIAQRIEGYERAKYVTIHAMLLIFFLIGTRMLLLFAKNNWFWILPFAVVYVLAWLLPYIEPNLSRVINREQLYPETRTGIFAFNLAWTLLPIITGASAFVGMWINRTDKLQDASIFIGLLFMIPTISFAQSASHQLWEQYRESKRAPG